jgi:hypothetical protein
MRWFACFLLLFVLGCQETKPETPQEKEQRLAQFAATDLPGGSKNVMDLGNNWYTFEARIEGKRRLFLFHQKGDYCGEESWAMESLTELAP